MFFKLTTLNLNTVFIQNQPVRVRVFPASLRSSFSPAQKYFATSLIVSVSAPMIKENGREEGKLID